jgi:hypothetical protein
MAAAGDRLAARQSATTDEPTHLSAGLSAWAEGDYRQSTGNLFFTQKWAAWPLFLRGVRPPAESVQRALQWNPILVGEALVFSADSDPRGLLAPARRMTLALCLLTGVLVWGWAGWLGGPAGAAFASLLYATSPAILANGVLVTTDTGAGFWYLAALISYAWLLRRPSALAAAAAGFCAAMMLLSKFSIVALLASAALLLAWHLSCARGRVAVAPLAGWHAAAGAVAWVTLWAFFGFQFRPGGYTYLSIEPSTTAERIVSALGRWHALPEPYLREVVTFEDMIRPRRAYLLGDFRMGGFWDYFPVAFVAKATVAMLLALCAGLLVLRPPKGGGGRALGFSALAAGALGYVAVAELSPLNIGARHILPLFVLGSVAGGVALGILARRGWIARCVAGAIGLLAAAEGFSARRQPLAWFNALAGGPMSGYRIMVDSSLEWGGDLPGLIEWEHDLRRRDSSSPVYVSLLGPPGHEHSGLTATNLEWAFTEGVVRPGYFVFGATRLVGGPVDLFGEWGEHLREEWNEKGASAWHGALPPAVAQLAVARLAASCRGMRPAERIGPVYFVYHLDNKALESALGRDATSVSRGARAADEGARP